MQFSGLAQIPGRVLVRGGRPLALLVAVLGVLLTGGPAQAAGTSFNPPKSFYLALGDSVTFGYQQVKFDSEFPNVDPSTFNTGFVDDFAGQMQTLRPGLSVVNLGCPGETTASFIQGPCVYQQLGLPLHTPYPGSQEAAALQFLRAHPGQVSPITISLGANDVQRCSLGDNACLAAEIQTAGSNLDAILGSLRAVAPNAEIIVLQYYNPFAVVLPATNAVDVQLNAAIAAAAAANAARVADAFTPFNLAAQEPLTLCVLTYFCTYKQDIHPTDAGYAVIADQFWSASGYARLTS